MDAPASMPSRLETLGRSVNLPPAAVQRLAALSDRTRLEAFVHTLMMISAKEAAAGDYRMSMWIPPEDRVTASPISACAGPHAGHHEAGVCRAPSRLLQADVLVGCGEVQ